MSIIQATQDAADQLCVHAVEAEELLVQAQVNMPSLLDQHTVAQLYSQLESAKLSADCIYDRCGRLCDVLAQQAAVIGRQLLRLLHNTAGTLFQYKLGGQYSQVVSTIQGQLRQLDSERSKRDTMVIMVPVQDAFRLPLEHNFGTLVVYLEGIAKLCTDAATQLRTSIVSVLQQRPLDIVNMFLTETGPPCAKKRVSWA
jgi:hypothetical protein